MKLPTCLAIALPLCAALSPATAQDIQAGHRVAQRLCRCCHEIEKGRFDHGIAPAFAEIAGRPTTTSSTVRRLFSKPHDRMPDFLMRQEIEDVSAYIVSLKTG